MRTIRYYGALLLRASRPLSWLNTAFACAAGVYGAGGVLRAPRNVLAIAYFTLPYNLLLYGVNDVCDYPSDRLNPRKNSVEGGLLPPETHRPVLVTIAALNVPFVAGLLVAGDGRAAAWLGGLLVTSVGYSAPPLRWKEAPGLDSVISATHFVTPFLYGLALNRAARYPRREIAAFTAWCLASHAFGAIQDVAFDRAAGATSIATALGAVGTARLAATLYAAAVGLILAGLPFDRRRGRRIAAAALLTPYAANAALFLRHARPERANRHWRVFLGLNLLVGAAYTIATLWDERRRSGRDV